MVELVSCKWRSTRWSKSWDGNTVMVVVGNGGGGGGGGG